MIAFRLFTLEDLGVVREDPHGRIADNEEQLHVRVHSEDAGGGLARYEVAWCLLYGDL